MPLRGLTTRTAAASGPPADLPLPPPRLVDPEGTSPALDRSDGEVRRPAGHEQALAHVLDSAGTLVKALAGGRAPRSASAPPPPPAPPRRACAGAAAFLRRDTRRRRRGSAADRRPRSRASAWRRRPGRLGRVSTVTPCAGARHRPAGKQAQAANVCSSRRRAACGRTRWRDCRASRAHRGSLQG